MAHRTTTNLNSRLRTLFLLNPHTESATPGLMRSRGVFFAIISWCGRLAIVEAATIPTVATLINITC
jgi:hypothetical protein